MSNDISYTVGNKKAYLKAMKQMGTIKKKGANKNYRGGIIFETIEQADNYLKSNNFPTWEVFGVYTNFKKNVKFDKDVEFHRLQADAEIFLLNDREYNIDEDA